MDTFKYILLSVFSALIGGGIGWFAARERYKVDYDIAVNEYFRSQENKIEDLEAEKEHLTKLKSSYEDRYAEIVNNYAKPSLEDLAQKYADKDLDRFVAERQAPDDDDLDEPIDIPRESPYIITSREFDESHPEYDKIYMSYYRDDDILAEDDYIDEMVEDPESIVGPDALTMFGWDEEEGNVVCVRNENNNTDYYITMIPGKYVELVQGIKDPIERRRTHDAL